MQRTTTLPTNPSGHGTEVSPPSWSEGTSTDALLTSVLCAKQFVTVSVVVVPAVVVLLVIDVEVVPAIVVLLVVDVEVVVPVAGADASSAWKRM